MNVRRLNPGFFTAVWLLPLVTMLQITVAGHFAVRGIFPGLMLITVVNWGILRGMDEGVLWAFIGGLCLDFFTGWPFGTSTVSLVMVASLVSLGEGTFMRTHALLPLATVFGATFLYYAIALFVLESTHNPVDWLAALQYSVFPIAVYNAVLNIPGFWLSRRLEARIYPMPRANW